MNKDKLLVTCFDVTDSRYGLIFPVSKKDWIDRYSKNWVYWRLLNDFEKELYHMGHNKIPKFL